MNTVTHWFFYSEKQQQFSKQLGHGSCFVIVNGERILYSEWQTSETSKGVSSWDDAILVATVVGACPNVEIEEGACGHSDEDENEEEEEGFEISDAYIAECERASEALLDRLMEEAFEEEWRNSFNKQD